MLDATLPVCKGIDSHDCRAETAGKPLRQAPGSTVVSCPGDPGPTLLEEVMHEPWPGIIRTCICRLAYQIECLRTPFVNPPPKLNPH